MPLILNGTTINKIIYNGTSLDSLKYNDVEVFKNAATITLVEGGTKRTIEASIGQTITPSATPLSYRTFVGWSKSSNGANPSKSIVVTGDMTLYRVVNIDDISATSYTINSFTTLTLPLSTYYYSSAYIELNGGNQAVIVNADGYGSSGYWYVNWSQSIPKLQSSYVFKTERSQPCTIIVYGKGRFVM